MIKIHKNFITQDAISWFKNDMNQRIQNNQYIEKKFWSKSLINELYNIDWDIQEFRYQVQDKDPAMQIMKNLLKDIIPHNVPFYAAYQRQFIPQSVHVDDINDNTRLDFCYSGILPLDPNNNNIHKTIVWDLYFKTTDSMHKYFETFDASLVDTNIINSDIYDLEHTLQGIFKPLNHLKLDGVYNYELGTLGLFDRTHAHCSSNWRKYNQCDYKDFIIFHFG